MKVIGGTLDYIEVETRSNHTIRISWDDHKKIKIVAAAVDNPDVFFMQALIYKAANSFDKQDEVASESGTNLRKQDPSYWSAPSESTSTLQPSRSISSTCVQCSVMNELSGWLCS